MFISLKLRRLLLLTLSLAAVGSMLTVMTNAQQQSVRHVVVFRYKPTATPAQIQQVTQAFRALRSAIPGITGYEDGINNSPEGKNQGFTHVYTLTFASVQARDAYLPHPKHQEFGKLLGSLGVLDDAFVVDYIPGGQ